MDTIEFLKRVLPSEGYYVSIVINPSGRQQGFFQSIEELAKACIRLDKAGNNTYFAISSFIQKGNRKQENVNKTKVLAIDVDCGKGKPYADWKKGLQALNTFIEKTKLPTPMIVSSGNGLHIYWILTEELEPEDWKPIANALKTSAIDKGFNIDAGLTSNNALVLRPVGTHNPKNGKQVKLLLDAKPVSVASLQERLKNYIDYVPRGDKARSSSLLASMAVPMDFPQSLSSAVYSKCQQIQQAVDNQKDVTEPIWYNLMGIAAYCIDPEDTAKLWSEGYPAYSEEATMSKLRHWKDGATGPTTCAKFDIDRPGGCKGCKYKGKIASPIRLGVNYKETELKNALDKTASEVKLPKPFKRTSEGIKITLDETDVDVCRFDIYPVSYGRDESLGYETVRYHWNRKHVGWQELVLRQAYLTEGHREFATAIADQGIVLYNKKQTEFFQLMLRTYMDELRSIRAMSNLYSSMGWKENNTQFVVGNTIFRNDKNDTKVVKESISLTSASNRVGQELYGTKGTLANWVELTNLLEKAGMPWHMFALGLGFSAPLYNFTGLKGLTISLYGPTGGGKTLAQYWLQSIYGDPEKLHFTAKYTQNTLFSRLGLYGHLPMTVDEVTMMQDKDVGDFCYWVSQGRDKARLNRNAEERDAKTWATPVIVSTNKSLQSKLIASGLETDAQMARLLEIPIPSHRMFTRDSSAGRKIYDFITSNYGIVGQTYINKLMELGPDVIQGMIQQSTEDFQNKYKARFTGEERYWEQAIILADLGLKLADDWNLIKFDYTKGTEWVLAQLGAIRRTVQDNKVDAFDLLAEYLNDSASAAVTVMHTAGHKPTVDLSRMPRADIRVRFDIHRNSEVEEFDKGTIMLDRTHFRKWLSIRGADYKSFTHELVEENVMATPKSQKFYLGKDTPVKLGQSYVIGINLNHPRLMGILDAVETDVNDLSFGKVKLM
tara:strand:+ start:7034 stop:9871 length:2838 start_codon:yes stop_codon:yes gene_type:complete